MPQAVTCNQASPEPSRRVEGPATDNPNSAPETPDPGEPVLSPASPEPSRRVEGPPAVRHDAPESPRLVTQIGDSLNQSLGPPPSAHTQDAGDAAMPSESPEPLDPFSIQSSIQEYILTITNNGQTLRATLRSIAFADPEDESVITFHRRRAATLLIDRLLGTDPNALRSAVCPECRRKWTTHPGSHDHPESDRKVSPGRQVRYVDPEALAKARAEIQRMKDEGILTPDPNGPKRRITVPEIPEDFDVTPYLKEGAAKFWADIELRYERQQKWPEIEERRRKKLAQIYPSHSEDDKPPDP